MNRLGLKSLDLFFHAPNSRQQASTRELLDKRLETAREVERRIRDEMLRCPTEYIENAAAKVVHLRRTFTQDHATSEAGGR